MDQSIYDAALNLGSGSTYDFSKTPDTVTSNAIDSMAPTNTSGGNGAWTDFWRGTASGLIGYAVQRDAQRNGISMAGSPAASAPHPQTGAQTAPIPKWFILAAVAAGVFALYHGKL